MSIRAKLIAAFLAIMVPLAFVGYFSYMGSKQTMALDAWVTHTHEVLGAVQAFLRSVHASESSARGFEISGDAAFLDAYQHNRAETPGKLAELRRLTSDNPAQQERLQKVSAALTQKLAVMDTLVEDRKQAKSVASRIDDLHQSRDLLHVIEAEIGAMVANEEELLAARQQEATRQAETTQRVMLVGTGLTLLIAVVMALLLSKLMVARIEALAAAADRLRAGNLSTRVQVGEGGGQDEFHRLAEGFNRMAEDLQARDAQLAQRSMEVERANKMKSEFLASMSHELRTPLNAILGFSELLEDQSPGPLNEKQVRFVAHIRTGARHLLQLINDILDLSKIEAGQLDLQSEDFQLSSVVPEVISLVRQLAMAKRLQLEVSPPDQGLVVNADRVRVKQVLYNLLSNAVKFTPEGGRITLEVTRYDQKPALIVTDTGVGIRKDDLERVFEEFRQVGDESVKPQGTGLGLAITRRLVEQQGGKVWVESEVGKGSKFIVLLSPGETAAGVTFVPAEPEPVRPAPGRERPLILVIDDDPLARQLIASSLTPDGFDVRSSDGGSSALSLARELQPDAITLDVLMPTSGWNIMGTLKKDPRTAAIPIIVVTVVDQRNAGYALGAADYLVKPVSRDALLRALRRQLAQATRPQRILVVDDNREDLQMVSELLDSVGFIPLQAEGGKHGLEMAREAAPDAMLLDLMMPDVDGFEVLRQMKQDQLLRPIPVFILTAKDLSAEETQFLSRQAEALLRKSGPWKEDLLLRLRQTLIVRAAGA
jgi:signal transduction histidine kinase/CheY-like chemotaxis protein